MKLFAAGIPIAGALGEYYLQEVRRISAPATGWPRSILWHPAWNAVLAVAVTAAVQAVQRIHLGADGRKIGMEEMQRRRLPAVKVTNGPQNGAAVRLPGPLDGPLLLAEGPETGLAAYTSSGFETWIALGAVGKLAPPVGRRVVVLADDDPRHAPATQARRRAIARWRRQGGNVVAATPWAVSRGDKSDMADVIVAAGPSGVRLRIERALSPSFERRSRVSVDEGRVSTMP